MSRPIKNERDRREAEAKIYKRDAAVNTVLDSLVGRTDVSGLKLAQLISAQAYKNNTAAGLDAIVGWAMDRRAEQRVEEEARELRDRIFAAIRKLTEEFTGGLTRDHSELINEGKCVAFADTLIERLGMGVRVWGGDINPLLYGAFDHAIVEIDGRCYDSETPYGVAWVHEIPFFVRARAVAKALAKPKTRY